MHNEKVEERKSISALLNTEEKNSEEDLCIEEPSTSKMNYTSVWTRHLKIKEPS
jgi:hypothetical protein